MKCFPKKFSFCAKFKFLLYTVSVKVLCLFVVVLVTKLPFYDYQDSCMHKLQSNVVFTIIDKF